MKFEDKENPYFGGGKMSMYKYVQKDLRDMEKEMQKEDFEGEDCYGVDITKTYTLTIAGGGPSMVIDIDTQNGEIIGGEYRYAWYTTPEIVELNESEAETVANYYGVTGLIESEASNE
jgi:hypothetical protein